MVFGVASAGVSQNVDPQALLKGVEQARLAVGPCTIEWEGKDQRFGAMAQVDDLKIWMSFDGDKRTVREFRRELVIDGKSQSEQLMKHNKLIAMKNNREEFVKQGLGRWRDNHIVSAWDGTNLAQKHAFTSTGYVNHHGGVSNYVFDPRTLGLTPYLSIRSTIPSSLGYGTADAFQTIKRENIVGSDVWRVDVNSTKNQYKSSIWIEDSNPFRVIRKEHTGAQKYIIRSQYDKSLGADPLPTTVVIETYSLKDSALESTTTIHMIKYKKGAIDNVGTIFSLAPSVGEPIVDQRIGKTIGYWNGIGLSDSIEEARATDEKAKRDFAWKWAGGGLFLICAISLVIFIYYYRSRRNGILSRP